MRRVAGVRASTCARVAVTVVSYDVPLTCTAGPNPHGTVTGASSERAPVHGSPTRATSPMTSGICRAPVAVSASWRVVSRTVMLTRRAVTPGRSTRPSRSTSRSTVRPATVTSTLVGRRPATSGSTESTKPSTRLGSGQLTVRVGRGSSGAAAQ